MTQNLRFKRLAHYGFGPLVMKKIRVCTGCGMAVKWPLSFCPSCMDKLSGETLFDRYKKKQVVCRECDSVLTGDSNFCPNCGVEVSGPLKATASKEK